MVFALICTGNTNRPSSQIFKLKLLRKNLNEQVDTVDQIEQANWLKIAESMEAAGTTESWFYKRARAIADGSPDPMPNVNELVPDTDSVDS